MSDAKDRPLVHASSINICIGGTQIINVTGGNPAAVAVRSSNKPSRFELLNNGVIPTGVDDNNWYVVPSGTAGVGRICRLSVTYADPVPDGQKVRGRVYQGIPTSLGDPGYDISATVDGYRESALKWTWSAAPYNLEGAAHSLAGSQNYCAFWIVDAADNSLVNFDAPLRSFAGITSPYGSGSGSCGGQAFSTGFAASRTLELQVSDGALTGNYMLRMLGPLVWRITAGPLKGCVDFFGDGNSLTVRTPFGERTQSVPQQWPYSLVLPGELFGSKYDVVVMAS